MVFIISPEQLHQQIKENDDVIIIDVRSDLLNPDESFAKYLKSHIPGAYYLHLTKDLSGEVKKHGGNHPLPDMEQFSKKLGEFGVTNESKVVVYDDDHDMFAPRAWWLLRYVGVQETFVLNGGFTAWVEASFEVTDEVPAKKNTTFIPDIQNNAIVSMEDVRDRDPKRTVLIDSRSYERYIGKKEPLYKKAGHIPGAVNYFWKDVFDERGNWKSAEQLQQHFRRLKEADEIIVSCGSGISACPNILALEMAGFKNVKLYPGSFSDWISYDENEVVRKEE